ncbi:MAG: crosslink repair DNA glycosylase YcaQ family protein [Bdellovibrionota bacterium]
MGITLTALEAKRFWLFSQRLLERTPFGSGSDAVYKAIDHLGYVQIDTINVIERAHHHILWSRIPTYRPQLLQKLQRDEKSIFEYWTHALAYVPSKYFPHYIGAMERFEEKPSKWFDAVTPAEIKRVTAYVKKHGPVSIRDMGDEVLVEKDHDWASKKPSKRVLQYLFNGGRVVISERLGMLKKYELTQRHFKWKKRPKASSEKVTHQYLLERSLKSQGLVSIASTTFLNTRAKAGISKVLTAKEKNGSLTKVNVKNIAADFWLSPDEWETFSSQDHKSSKEDLVHILSPFDPLVIQRKRLKMFFNYEHRFEAYVPKEKRMYGYFALPVIVGDEVVALLDMKTDRQNKKLLLQQWTWLPGHRRKETKMAIEAELDRFALFQLQQKFED